MAASRSELDPPPPIRGELLKIDDRYTGFSPDDPKDNRPYVVIGTAGRRVRVVPHSTKHERGVWIPDGVGGLEEGRFVPYGATVGLRFAASRSKIGHLEEPYLEQVMKQAKPWPPR
jgi:hypothetical protein